MILFSNISSFEIFGKLKKKKKTIGVGTKERTIKFDNDRIR